MSEAAFAADRLVVDAVERNFTVIGEATRQIPAKIQEEHPDIPWALMLGMRNILVHEYDAVRLDVVWRTIQEDLPPLIEPLHKLMRDEPE